jgi:hypothetical protein
MKASEYRKLRQSNNAKEKIYDVTLPSGCVWKMRTPPIQQFMLAGKLPKDLATKMVDITSSGGTKAETQKKIAETMTATELTQTLAFGRDLLLHCAVEPRIVLNPDPDSEYEIAPEEIDPVDFDFLLAWVMKGGNPGEALGSFRKKRR